MELWDVGFREIETQVTYSALIFIYQWGTL